MTRRSHWLTLAAITLLLAGCATQTSPAASPSTGATTSSPTPADATPTPAPVDAAPVLPYGGECDAVVTAAELEEAVGVGAELHSGSTTSIAIQTHGGLVCRWRSVDTALSLAVTVLPSAEVTDGVRDEWAEPLCSPGAVDAPQCHAAVEASGVWSLVVVDVAGAWDAEPRRPAELDALAERVAARAGDHPAPRPVPSPEGARSTPTCDEAAAQMDLAGLLGSDDFEFGFGSDGGFLPEDRVARALGFQRECSWTAYGDGIHALGFTVIPAAAWAAEPFTDILEAPAEPLTVAGAVFAARSTPADIFPAGVALTEAEGVHAWVTGDAEVADVLAQVVAALAP